MRRVLTLFLFAAVPALLPAQRSQPMRPVRGGAGAATSSIGDAVAQLSDPDPAVRAAAATALAARRTSIPDSVVAASVVPPLARAIERESDDAARAAELRLVGDIGTASPADARAIRPALPAVIARWRQEMTRAAVDPPARTTLVRLGPAGAPEVMDAVRAVLTERCALQPARGMLASPGSVTLVRGDNTACTDALLVLAAAGRATPDESAALAAPYVSLLGGGGVGEVAARTLAGFGEPGAQVLLAAARDRNPDRSDHGVTGLAHVLTPVAVDTLAAIVRDVTLNGRESAGVSRGARLRIRAAMTLGRFGAPLATPALPVLADAANGPGPAQVRIAALVAYRALRSGQGLPRDRAEINDIGMFEPVGPLPAR